MGAICRDILQRGLSYLPTFSCFSFRQLRAIATMTLSYTFMQRRRKTIRSIGQPADNTITSVVEIASRGVFVTFKSILTSRENVPAIISSDLSVTSHSLKLIFLIPEMMNDAILRSDTSLQVKQCDVTISKQC